jgi:hypothetical protein
MVLSALAIIVDASRTPGSRRAKLNTRVIRGIV